jgi:RNA recognition motif-containing protein
MVVLPIFVVKKYSQAFVLLFQKERKIVYVGRIPDGFTRRQLRKRFERFGEIEEVSVHFREGDHK